jgi:hypothetical protein
MLFSFVSLPSPMSIISLGSVPQTSIHLLIFSQHLSILLHVHFVPCLHHLSKCFTYQPISSPSVLFHFQTFTLASPSDFHLSISPPSPVPDVSSKCFNSHPPPTLFHLFTSSFSSSSSSLHLLSLFHFIISIFSCHLLIKNVEEQRGREQRYNAIKD